jgi:hypothetical protein
MLEQRGPFEKLVYSPYYSESELCEGAVTVSFSKYPYNAPPTSRKCKRSNKASPRTFQTALVFHYNSLQSSTFILPFIGH